MTSRRNEKAEALAKIKKSKPQVGRIISTRNKQYKFLIVCEGEKTEPNYFRSLIKDSKYSRVVDANIKGEGMSTCALVKRTLELKKEFEESRNIPFDRVWVVFDKDDFKDFNEAIELAKKLKIKAAWSNESFELWYYLHFEYLDTAIKRDSYIKKLNTEIRKLKKDKQFKYKKNDANFYVLLKSIGNEDNAKKFAKRLRKQYSGTDYSTHKPCTMVDLLVEELEYPEKNLARYNL